MKKILFISQLLSLSFFSVPVWADEDLALTTYYPSADMAYTDVKALALNGRTNLAAQNNQTLIVGRGLTPTANDKMLVAGSAVVGSAPGSGAVVANGGIRIPQRTSDPTNAVAGEIWLRTDLKVDGTPS